MHVTPGQAAYVIDRLISERRLTTADVRHYLDELHREISTTEERLAQLRAAIAPHTTVVASHTGTERQRSSNAVASNNLSSNTTASNTTPRKRRFSPGMRAQQQLQGRYAGYLRQLAAHIKPRFQAIKARDGITAAITALRDHLGK
jgi:hypothetical protein